MSDKPIPMPWAEREQMPPAFENRSNNLDEIGEKDIHPDPARHQCEDDNPEMISHPRSDFPYRQ